MTSRSRTDPSTAEEAPAGSTRRVRRSLLLRRRGPSAETARMAAEGAAPPTPPAVPADSPGDESDALLAPPAPTARPGALRRRRRRLLRRRQDAVYHLGGLAFELFRRDLLREDVMRRRAARVEALDDTVRMIDARLEADAAARRETRGGAAIDPVAGSCTACRTPFRSGARFCSNCGVALMAPGDDGDEDTRIIPPPRDAEPS